MTPLAIDKVLSDTRLLGAGLGNIETWATWTDRAQGRLRSAARRRGAQDFAAVAGGRAPPKKRVRELWCIVGRSGGKIAHGCGPRLLLRPVRQAQARGGERGMVLVLSATPSRPKCVRLRAGVPERIQVLARRSRARRAARSGCSNGIVIAVHPNCFRWCAVARLCACIFDEIAFWSDDTTATPDAEVYSAVLPALITTNGMLVGISALSPHWFDACQAQAPLRRR